MPRWQLKLLRASTASVATAATTRSAEAAGHVVGYTDIDDHGQGGLEAAYDGHLRGTPGKERIVLDARRRRVALLETIAPPQPGKDLKLSIDRRIQYLAYRELKAAVLRHKAASGMAVMLDVASGEVLAMVNQPTFNPNDPQTDQASGPPPQPGRHRSVRARLHHQAVHRGRRPGAPQLRPAPRDRHLPRLPARRPPYRARRAQLRRAGHGRRDPQVEQRRRGADRPVHDARRRCGRASPRFGFGVPTSTGFPGEASGLLRAAQSWRRVEQVTMAFGYGVSGTALQLARAYAALASGGLLRPVSFLAVSARRAAGR